MFPTLFLILTVWCALSFLAVPVGALVGRASRQADRDAARQHRELFSARL